MPLNNILDVKLFDVWGINFIGYFVFSCSNKYILVTIDCVSMWVEVIALPTSDAKVLVKFLKSIFLPYLVLLVLLLLMGVLISTISNSSLFWPNIISSIKLTQPIIHKVVVKLRFLSERLSIFLRKL